MRKSIATGLVTFILLIAILFISINTVFFSGTEDLSNVLMGNIISDLISILLCTIIFMVVFLDLRDNRATRIFLLLLFIETVLLFADIHCWVWDGDQTLVTAAIVANIVSYLCVLLLLTFYWALLLELYKPFRKRMAKFTKVIIALAVTDVILIVTNPLTGLFFVIDSNALYVRSDTFLLSLLAPNFIGLIEVYCILKFETKSRRKIVFIGYILFSWIAMFIQLFNYGISLQYVSFMFSFVLMYANIYLDRGTELIFNESRMNEQNAAIMVSQIQPHFLYNSLTSIMNIKGNPPQTRDAIAEFGGYLRANLDSMTTTNPIPVQREIEHVESYIYLRKLKFGDRLNIIYNIEDTSFFLPPETIKTIVSSVIEYNLVRDEQPLTITLSTENTEKYHVVRIYNDSVTPLARGFIRDKNNIEIAAMVNRLNTMVGGTLKNIEDSRGGNTVEIRIPHSSRY